MTDCRLGSMLNGDQVVDVAGGSLSDSAQVQLYCSNYTLAQYWTFTYNKSTGYYTVRSAVSGKVLDCRGDGVSNGTAIQQYAENGTTAHGGASLLIPTVARLLSLLKVV